MRHLKNTTAPEADPERSNSVVATHDQHSQRSRSRGPSSGAIRPKQGATVAVRHERTNSQGGGEVHSGQVRIAYRLQEMFTGKLLFVEGLGWHAWDGHRWAHGSKAGATAAVLEVLRAALAESLDDHRLRRDVQRCETASGVKGVLAIAATLPDLYVAAEEVDADPYLLNCANGTLDLRTRRLRSHDPADMITKVCRGSYKPNARNRRWKKFLAKVLPDPDVRSYTCRVFGQAAFGGVREHLFPVLVGKGENGKGATYGAIFNAMGDYGAIIDPSLLLSHEGRSNGPEMMQLRGARLVIGSETDEGKQLNSSLMKRLAGGDAITARNHYQSPVTWEPSHLLVYVTNHVPKVKGSDAAVWRRLRLILFDVTVPEHERDAQLPERLKKAADEVLTWVVQGWYDYEDVGMQEPQAVLVATDAYRTASDPVKRFIEEACLTGPQHSARSRDLFLAWTTWAKEDGAEPLSEKALALELDRLGFEGKKTNSGKIRSGITLPSLVCSGDE